MKINSTRKCTSHLLEALRIYPLEHNQLYILWRKKCYQVFITTNCSTLDWSKDYNEIPERHYKIWFALEQGKSSKCVGYSDSDWEGDLDNRRFTSGYNFQSSSSLGKQNAIIFWTFHFRGQVISSAGKEAVWKRLLIIELCGSSVEELLSMTTFNQIAMAKIPKVHGHTSTSKINIISSENLLAMEQFSLDTIEQRILLYTCWLSVLIMSSL